MILPRRLRPAPAFCLAMLLIGCAGPPPAGEGASCPASQGARMLQFQLFFGRSIRGQGEVTDAAWDGFLQGVVTPDLPNGYTVFDGTGAWLNPGTGRTIHERTKILLVALPDAAASTESVGHIRSAYAAQFHQAAVGMTVGPVCGSF